MGGSSSKASPSTRVVFIGGGLGAGMVAEKLQNDVKVTIIDRLPVAYYPIGSLRSAVTPKFEDSLYAPRDRRLAKCELVVGTVSAVNTGVRTVTVVDAAGKTLSVPYDVLVIATGITYGAPGHSAGSTVAEGKDAARRIQRAVEAASRILVVGGGPIGVELAGEIKGHAPAKEVTIVHSGAHLISGAVNGLAAADTKLGDAVLASAKAMGITVRLGERVTSSAKNAEERDAAATAAGLKVVAPGVYAGATSVSTSGAPVEVDLQFWCGSGGSPNTAFLAGTLPLTPAGYVQVEPTLQVVGHPRIFAMGDCAASGMSKTVVSIMMAQATPLLKNIHATAAAKEGQAASLVAAKPMGMAMMLVTLGDKSGSARMGPFVFGNWFSTKMKSGDLMVPKFAGDNRYKLEELRGLSYA